jgi:hypothetical protein
MIQVAEWVAYGLAALVAYLGVKALFAWLF